MLGSLPFSVIANTCLIIDCEFTTEPRVCLKNHSRNLHAPICSIFYLHSVDVARYVALFQEKFPTNCNAHLAESIFQTHSRVNPNSVDNSLFLYIL